MVWRTEVGTDSITIFMDKCLDLDSKVRQNIKIKYKFRLHVKKTIKYNNLQVKLRNYRKTLNAGRKDVLIFA